MNNLYYQIGFILIILLANGCIRCEEEELAVYTLSDEDKEIVPYYKDQQFIFIHNEGLQVDFTVVNRNSTLNQYYYFDEGCSDYYSSENNRTVLSSDYPDFDIELNISWGGIDKIGLNISVNETSFVIPDLITQEIYYTYNTSSFIEEIYIDSTLYYDVCEVSNLYDNPYYVYPSTIFYNMEFGLIQIKMSNNETYTLMQ